MTQAKPRAVRGRRSAGAEPLLVTCEQPVEQGQPPSGDLDAVQILESMSDAFVAVDRNWRFTYANPKAEQVFRMSRRRLMGAHCWALFPEGLRTAGRKRLEEAMEGGRSAHYLEYSLRYGIWFEVTAYPNPDGLSIYFRDVSERVAWEQKLRLHERAIEASVNAIVITTGKRQGYAVVHVNPAFERITGYSASEVIGQNCRFLYGEDLDQPALLTLRALIDDEREGRVTLRNYRKDGSLFYNDLHLAPVRDVKGRTTHFVGVLNDITETRRYQEELERHINHDALTGLANRNLLHDRLQQAINRAARRESVCAVIFLDLDHFKLVNDGLGHHWGDLLLKAVSEELLCALRPEDTVARFGGDEYVLVVNDLADAEAAAEVAQRVVKCVQRTHTLDDEELNVSASLGIALYPTHGDTADELLKNADAAMYDAKQSGRNTFSFYRKEMNGTVSQRFLLKTKLAKAIDNGELALHYQPQVSAQNGLLVGMEALLRWTNPELGRISPDRFIPLAEESGMIVPIGDWVLRTACELGRALLDSESPVERISVNLSARQFYQTNLAQLIERTLNETRLPPSCLELEITESIMMGHTEKVLRIMRELKEMKVSLAVDDFGTGYSSLGYLRHFPIDRLKIDRSFINDVPSNQHDCTITNAIITLGHNLGLTVIAEGVETSEQLAFLAQNGCDEVQGYLISKPLDEATLREYLSRVRTPAR